MNRFKISRIFLAIAVTMLMMLVYFLLANPALNDDGFHYEGFAESTARGKVDFKNFYGFQGLSFLAVPIFWVTHSPISIIITSTILSLLSLPLAYLVGKEFYQSDRAGLFFMGLILLMPYPYTTMMRGFQEAALLFFILLIIYASLRDKKWTPLAWTMGGIIKPFALTLFPLWLKKDFFREQKLAWLVAAAILGMAYLGASYMQTGHLINNAALNSYRGPFDTGHPPPLNESFAPSVKNFGRAAANIFVSSRKIIISPLVIFLGVFSWIQHKSLRLRKEIGWAVILNFLLVGSLTFSFSKYLIPMVVLIALMSIPVLIKSGLAQILVLVDSWFVFKPIYVFFGHNFWSSFPLFLLPWFLAAALLFWQRQGVAAKLIWVKDGSLRRSKQ